MKYPHLVLLFLFSLVSCTNKQNDSIIGLWESTDKENYSAFEFFNDGTVDNKAGFYQRNETFRKGTKPYTYFPANHILSFGYIDMYKGNLTEYKMNKDTLLIFNLENRKWDKFIITCKKDNLIIKDTSGNQYKYQRSLDENEKVEPQFDQITFYARDLHIASHQPCFFLSIDKSGKALMTEFGWEVYTYQLSPKAIDRLNKMFLKSGLDSAYKLNEKFPLRYGEYNPTEISIVRNNKIYTLQQPWLTHPDLRDKTDLKNINLFFVGNMLLHRYLPAVNKFRGSKVFNKSLTSFFFSYFRETENKEQCSYLTTSQGFYLWTLLADAKTSNHAFVEKYILDSSRASHTTPKDELIYTDGRYYRYKDQILDIGFNYLEENNSNRPVVEADYEENCS